MFKNFIKALPIKIAASIGVAVLSIFGLSGCGGSATAEPTNLNGTYVFTDGAFAMVGEVVDDTILIHMKGENSQSLYWSGDFKNPAKDGDVITSKGNLEQMKKSLTGSTADVKEFTIVDGKITFELRMMGVTTQIELEKNSSSTN
jgi:hypothetical protein